MALSDMEVFNQYFMPATIETLAQEVEKFNEASGGAILLTTDGFDGNFLQTSFYQSLVAARRRVGRFGPNNEVASVDLTQLEHNTVKVAGGFGPVRYEPSQMTWLRKPTREGVEVASRAFAEAMLQDQLNTTIAALVAAIGNQGETTTVDVSGDSPLDYETVNESHALFGDNSSRLVAEIMSGRSYHSFVGQNLRNENALFSAGSVRVVDILGKLVVVTDAPALYTPASGEDAAKRRVLSLVQGGASVHDGRDIISNIQTTNGRDRIETTLQVDYSFGIGLRGYSWDTGNGGASPSDAALATGANWNMDVSDVKHSAGVLAVGAA
ncbi:major capsid protein [Vreelandella populi]|uniref:major capsid protein n=1 Tax=Vreelandella populi TaxID=2498858 RepID=UPI000F8C6540|nr:major capsid protein [Halomonas populi]RUR38545.1 hypothetical protein ELY25_09285 [Halomonas populi]